MNILATHGMQTSARKPSGTIIWISAGENRLFLFSTSPGTYDRASRPAGKRAACPAQDIPPPDNNTQKVAHMAHQPSTGTHLPEYTKGRKAS